MSCGCKPCSATLQVLNQVTIKCAPQSLRSEAAIMPVDRKRSLPSALHCPPSAEEVSCLLMEIARDDWGRREPCPSRAAVIRAADSPRAACTLASCPRDIPPSRCSQPWSRRPLQPSRGWRAIVGHSRASAFARRFRTTPVKRRISSSSSRPLELSSHASIPCSPTSQPAAVIFWIASGNILRAIASSANQGPDR